MVQRPAGITPTYQELTQLQAGLIQRPTGIIPTYQEVIQSQAGLIQRRSGIIPTYQEIIQPQAGLIQRQLSPRFCSQSDKAIAPSLNPEFPAAIALKHQAVRA